jgi:hypothetical protein
MAMPKTKFILFLEDTWPFWFSYGHAKNKVYFILRRLPWPFQPAGAVRTREVGEVSSVIFKKVLEGLEQW